MHQDGVLDYINAERFGVFFDRRQVAGFESHRFARLPKVTDNDRLQRVELVGLVKHPEPVHYISDHLPQMDELATAPIRPLDAFERLGLTALQKGDDLFVRETETSTRVLGSVRALKECTECHACERGHLLGAFSYTLQR